MFGQTRHHYHCSDSYCPRVDVVLLLYSRDALVLGESEKDAKEHFHAKLQESRKNSFYTSMNWFIHGLAKDNRQ